ncbi:metallophosphoesterase family protein [Limobrevibacterium gyesilva]|uniref:Metallophosphoesterase n=1 Tax=Limobrevibacterium gyesilva TaxID=2991712 RepID=A0AA41YKR1_9PROT|nr:metallophosphoesterase [Limobrevibacterium gyesilva]MCW3473683.1 metallophosphoesterase [Limobrevibacterium gyesilva]
MAAVPALSAALLPSVANAQTQSGAFSFAACGDSRPMMYLPYKDGRPDLVRLFVEMFGLVMPERVAEEVVKRDVKLMFDPATNELTQVIMPFMSRSEVMTLSVDQGWVTRATVEDVKLLPGVHREIFQLQGGEWVAREIVRHVQGGRAKFVINSGDVVWWGNQGHLIDDSPYWKRVNDTMLKLLPPPDDEMRAAGLDGRWYISVGNHEVWGDPKIEGTLAAVPYLKKFGVTPERLIYTFDFRDVRFIFLWTGKYDYRSPSLWDGDRPKYAEQMVQMQRWLDDAKAKGMKKAFIVFHYPVFGRAGLGPIPEPDNPHKLIAAYAKDMEVVVFNGHVHTTELYDVDGVKYLMLGGGGAEQDPILPGRTSIKVPADYPPDLYWKGKPPQEEYNYVLVDVVPSEKTRFTLSRFRPTSAEPFASEALFT